jgi:hypothetical protein
MSHATRHTSLSVAHRLRLRCQRSRCGSVHVTQHRQREPTQADIAHVCALPLLPFPAATSTPISLTLASIQTVTPPLPSHPPPHSCIWRLCLRWCEHNVPVPPPPTAAAAPLQQTRITLLFPAPPSSSELENWCALKHLTPIIRPTAPQAPRHRLLHHSTAHPRRHDGGPRRRGCRCLTGMRGGGGGAGAALQQQQEAVRRRYVPVSRSVRG